MSDRNLFNKNFRLLTVMERGILYWRCYIAVYRLCSLTDLTKVPLRIMSTATTRNESGDPPNAAHRDYFALLNNILNTNPSKKLEKIMKRVANMKDSTSNTGTAGDTAGGCTKLCVLSETIACNKRCITKLHMGRDNLMSAFMVVSDSKDKKRGQEVQRQLTATVGNLINFCNEGGSLARKIHENAMGLHIVADFFRNPKDLSILNFSKNGRISVSHYSGNEATSMCLTWLHKSIQKLARITIAAAPVSQTDRNEAAQASFHFNVFKIYNSFENAVAELKNSAQLVCQVFRVLLYANTQGKEMLQKYVEGLSIQEINDIVTELQQLRRQYDEIAILLDRLGWSLADIWARCTGKVLALDDLRSATCFDLKRMEDSLNGDKISSKSKSKQKSKAKKQLSELSLDIKYGKKKGTTKPKFISRRSRKAKAKDMKIVFRLERVLGRFGSTPLTNVLTEQAAEKLGTASSGKKSRKLNKSRKLKSKH